MQNAFFLHLKRLGYSASTLAGIRQAVAEYEACGRKLVAGEMEAHVAHLKQRPSQKGGALSPSSIKNHLYGLQLYCNWLLEQGFLQQHPMSHLKKEKMEYPRRFVPSREQVAKLYEAAKTCPESRALLAVFYGCGLRRSEGVRLDVADVAFRKGLVYVRYGKGKKHRAVPLSEGVKADLRAYRNAVDRGSEMAFFINERGRRMQGASFDKRLRKLCTQVGLQENVTLHSLRHAIATHLLHGGMPVEQVRAFLGHRCLETTQLYTRINELEIIDEGL
jgi:integrase/recombinase XerD